MRHVITLADITSAEFDRVFSITEDLKSKYLRGLREPLLPGRVMALLFEKPSLRTRVSFESAICHLGGNSMFLGEDVGFGKRESLEDFARVLSAYVDVIVARANEHDTVATVAAHASCSVINGLTNRAHPCQALADLYTMCERLGTLSGAKLAFIGDGNNVARSLAMGCGKVGMRMALAAPDGYQFDDAYLATLAREVPDFELMMTDDPAEAVQDAAAVYTDVWYSMGQESERDARRRVFADFQVNARLMQAAPADACFLHCLPAHRGEEVTDDVLDGPQSMAVAQAANRMHVQKGVLAWLLAAQPKIS